MRFLKFTAIVCVFVAVSSPAMATTSPPWGADPGPGAGGAQPIYCHLNDYTMSRIYTGYLADGQTPVTSGVKYDDPGTQLQYYSPLAAASDTETGWGVFRLAAVYEGEMQGPNNIVKLGPPNILWQDGQGNKEIVGVFYGQEDTAVTFVNLGDPDPSTWMQVIAAQSNRYEMWYQDWKTYDEGAAGSAGRATPTTDPEKYETIGYDYDPNSGTWTQYSHAERVLTGNSVAGDQSAVVQITFTPPSSGNLNTYLLLDGGNWEDAFVEVFPFGGAGGTVADLRLKVTTSATTKADWTLSSSDPLTGATLIPEPLTMLALGLSAACVGGYIRKRRRQDG